MTDPSTWEASRWEADVVLNDGGIATLRQTRPEDRQALVEFYDRVSDRSKYLRFFGAHPTLSEQDLDTWTFSDERDEVSIVLVERERIVGTARFALAKQFAPARVADVSFLVQDDHQGRGGGNILLEHLAQIGRECEIERFFAETLTENRSMVQVFIRAGYQVKPELEDGFIVVDFSLDPTEESKEVMLRRELRAEANSIRRLLRPEVIAVVGHVHAVSRIVSSIVSGEFTGTLNVLTHNGDKQLLGEIPGDVDLVIVDHDSGTFDQVVEIAAQKNASGILVLAQGHNPSITQEESQRFLARARELGLRVLGPAALGVVNTAADISLNASPAPMPRRGHAGLFTQSAGVATLALSHALHRDCGISNFIASGSYADVTGNDVIQFWTQDEDTRVCLLSLDTIGNPRKFFRVLRRLALEKHVVVFIPSRALQSARSGASDAPQASASAIDEVIRQTGAIVVTQRDTMFDIERFLSTQRPPEGLRVAIISNSAGLSQQMAQSAVRFGLEPSIIPTGQNPLNAITLAARQASHSPDFDLFFVGVVEINDPIAEGVLDALEEINAAPEALPMIATRVSLNDAPHTTRRVPVYETYADALEAVALIVETEKLKAHARPHPEDEIGEVDLSAAQDVIDQILSQTPEGRVATDKETAQLLATAGITLIPWREVNSFDEALEAAEEFGWNVVLKSVHPVVQGRPELNAVVRGIDDPEAMEDAWESLGKLAPMLGIAGALRPVVQPTVPPGPSLSIRAIEDPVLGPMISCGIAGVATDLLGDTAWRTPSVRRSDARAMLDSLKAAPLLYGHHGSTPVQIEPLEELIMAVAQLKDEFPQILDIQLVPVIAGTTGASVVGARIRLAPSSSQRDPLTRAL